MKPSFLIFGALLFVGCGQPRSESAAGAERDSIVGKWKSLGAITGYSLEFEEGGKLRFVQDGKPMSGVSSMMTEWRRLDDGRYLLFTTASEGKPTTTVSCTFGDSGQIVQMEADEASPLKRGPYFGAFQRQPG